MSVVNAGGSFTAPPDRDPRLIEQAPGIRGLGSTVVRRFKQGELGSVPVIVALLVISVFFQSRNSNFLSAGNISNLLLQMAAMVTLSTGIVLVLLLGEVDLSAGSVAGVSAATVAVLSVRRGWPPMLAILAVLALGALIGCLHGFWVTRFGVPSFVVTLAGLIGWQGLQLRILGKTGSLGLPSSVITKITSTYFTDAVGWTLAVIAVAGYVAVQLVERRRRASAGLRPRPDGEIALRSIVVGALVFGVVAILNRDVGVPLVISIVVGLVVILHAVTTRTRYGRYIYAVGGNAEAARRAGIPVSMVRISVFMLASTFAAFGGVLLASRSIAANTSTGSSDLLLLAIAAAVIGGTSLFGGRGTVWAAVLGGLVLQAISNGMDLLQLQFSSKLIITGSVLLAAVTVDAVARQGRQHAGRA